MPLRNEEVTYSIIGAAMEVHNQLGHGFLEGIYQEALEIELRLRGIKYSSQEEVIIYYKGQELNFKYKPDFLIENKVIVEIKALSKLSGIEESQLLNYLKASEKEVGILINFGAPSLEWKRMVLSASRKNP